MSDKKWTSKNFKKAAQKHYFMCSYLLDNLQEVGSDKKPHIISDLFYLSGYILECILKYCIMEQLHKTAAYNLYEIEKMQLKTHNIEILWNKACENRGINNHNFEKWHLITKKWTEQIRYDTDDNDFTNHKLVSNHFKEIVTPIYYHIINKY